MTTPIMIPPKLRIVEKVTLYLDDELISGIEPNMYASRETGAWYMFDEAVEGSTNEFKDYKGNHGNAVLYSANGVVRD